MHIKRGSSTSTREMNEALVSWNLRREGLLIKMRCGVCEISAEAPCVERMRRDEMFWGNLQETHWSEMFWNKNSIEINVSNTQSSLNKNGGGENFKPAVSN